MRGIPLITDHAPQDDFTETAYRSLVERARERYAFLSFTEAAAAAAGVLWRHDIDISVHRAFALAAIESALGVRATYFVHLRSHFYNAFEDACVERLRAIAAMGHEIGLHFEARAFAIPPDGSAPLAHHVAAEATAMAELIGVTPVAVSFHDPDGHGHGVMGDDVIAGLVNAYGRTIQERFRYCSDSNGYWRFTSLDEELRSGSARLQVLTHPEWWVPEVMSPRDRIARAIDGRARSVAAGYDRAIDVVGRENRR